MAETDGSPTKQAEYKLIVDEVVVEKIAAYATQKIEGVIEMKGNLLSSIQEGLGGTDRTKGVSADINDDNRVSIELSLILEYGKSAADVFESVKKVVAKDVRNMTGLNLDEMTVHVVDVMSREEYKKRNSSGSSSEASQ